MSLEYSKGTRSTKDLRLRLHLANTDILQHDVYIRGHALTFCNKNPQILGVYLKKGPYCTFELSVGNT